MFVLEIVLVFQFISFSSSALCPIVSTQKQFDVEKYAGVWYEVYRHDVNEVNTKCENGTFTPGQNGTMQVQSQGFNQLNGYFNHTGLAKPRSTNEPASFLIHYVKPTETLKYHILQTDYQQYSLVYSCDYVPIVGIRFELVWFLSRNKTLSDSIVTEMKKVLKEKHIETTDIKPTAQDC